MALYNASGQMNLTETTGTTLTGSHAPDGSQYIVINDGSSYTGFRHPSGAINAVVATNGNTAAAPNGGMYVYLQDSGTAYTPVGGSSGTLPATLLLDTFTGNGSVTGRTPNIGPVWATTGAAAANMETLSGEMYQNGGAGQAGYATSATSQQIKELGCKFRLSSITYGATLSGTPDLNDQIGFNIYPSGNPNFTQVSYTLTGVDTLATAATALAANITANATMIANGITATANGTTVTFTATRMPRAVPFGVGVGFASVSSMTPTIAAYITGADFLQNMLHFRVGPDGVLEWTIFDASALTLMNTITTKTIGLTAGVEYTYRCCISAPYVWGGIWQGSTLQSCAVGQDTRVAARAGQSCFFETFDPNILFYNEAWAYNKPTVSRTAIEAALV